MSKLPPPAVTVEFRDGERDIPRYLFDLMAGIETYSVTYDEAITIVNNKMASDHANRVMKKVIRDHFRLNN